ncbi:hypothetical protein [Breoghania sp.]|uniref:hypothetical protein n=1 Tax=Breoghania sp. TaxID=2065378 RepID=UPI00260687FC|nr:hypothetical protein [Breoghania sp.]MDJ0932566.1 hypothetical protein [Breoghania sp.]
MEAVLRRSQASSSAERGIDLLVGDVSGRLEALRSSGSVEQVDAGSIRQVRHLVTPGVLLAVGLALCAQDDVIPSSQVSSATEAQPSEPESEVDEDVDVQAQQAAALEEVRKVGEEWTRRNTRIQDMAVHLEETVSVALTSLKMAAGAVNEAVEAVAVMSKNILGAAADWSGDNHRAVIEALAAAQTQRDEFAGSLRSIGALAERADEAVL